MPRQGIIMTADGDGAIWNSLALPGGSRWQHAGGSLDCNQTHERRQASTRCWLW
jgi:hypothetical protein